MSDGLEPSNRRSKTPFSVIAKRTRESTITAYNRNKVEERILKLKISRLYQEEFEFREFCHKERSRLIQNNRTNKRNSGWSPIILRPDEADEQNKKIEDEVRRRLVRPWAFTTGSTSHNVVYQNSSMIANKFNFSKSKSKIKEKKVTLNSGWIGQRIMYGDCKILTSSLKKPRTDIKSPHQFNSDTAVLLSSSIKTADIPQTSGTSDVQKTGFFLTEIEDNAICNLDTDSNIKDVNNDQNNVSDNIPFVSDQIKECHSDQSKGNNSTKQADNIHRPQFCANTTAGQTPDSSESEDEDAFAHVQHSEKIIEPKDYIERSYTVAVLDHDWPSVDDKVVKTKDDSFVLYRGHKLKNYIRPENRYKVDPFLLKKREKLISSLTELGPLLLEGSRENKIKIDVAFPKAARRRILEKLVEENTAKEYTERYARDNTFLQKKVEHFLKDIKEFCKTPKKLNDLLLIE